MNERIIQKKEEKKGCIKKEERGQPIKWPGTHV
jgi:hypothetical protein